MRRRDDHAAAEPVPLPEPRPLTRTERKLVDVLLAGPLGGDELRRQAETARVGGRCSCGCAAVWLDVDPAAPVARFRDADTPLGRTEWIPITARHRQARAETEVTLHVVEGRLHELEVWAGRDGVRPRVDATRLRLDVS